MPQTDPIQGFTGLPAYTDPYAIPDTLKALYGFLLARGIPVFATTTARDAALTTPTDGMVCVTGTGTSLILWVRQAGAWQTLWQPPIAWTTVTLASGFTQGSGADAPFSVSRDSDGVVRWRGQIYGTFAANTIYTVVATGGVPSWARPAWNLARGIVGTNAAADCQARLTVAGAGSVEVRTAGATPYLLLDGLGPYRIS